MRTRLLCQSFYLLILGCFSYLYLRISEQSLIYGDVKTNLDRYTAALEEKELEFENISGLLSKKVSELAVTNRAWLEESSELQRVQADLEAARGKLEKSVDELQKTLERNASLKIKNKELDTVTAEFDDKSQRLKDLNSQINTLLHLETNW